MLLFLLSLGLFLANTFLASTGGIDYVLNLKESLGSKGSIAGIFLVAFVALLLPPILLWRRVKKGFLAWTFVWNALVLGLLFGLAPGKQWLHNKGTAIPAEFLGQDSWLVKSVLHQKLGWGPERPVAKASEPNEAVLKTDQEAPTPEKAAEKTPEPRPSETASSPVEPELVHEQQTESVTPSKDDSSGEEFSESHYESLLSGSPKRLQAYVKQFPQALETNIDNSPAGIRTLIIRNRRRTVKWMLSKGVSLKGVDGILGDALASQISFNRKAETLSMMLKAGASGRGTGSYRMAPLHSVHTVPMVKQLLANGADVNERNSKGETPLHAMVTGIRPHETKLLVDSGADVNARDDRGRTPLFSAQNSPRTVAVLLAGGAKVEVADGRGKMVRQVFQDNLLEQLNENPDYIQATERKLARMRFSLQLLDDLEKAQRISDSLKPGPKRRYKSTDGRFSAIFPFQPKYIKYAETMTILDSDIIYQAGYTTPTKTALERMRKPRSGNKEFKISGCPAIRTTPKSGVTHCYVFVGDSVIKFAVTGVSEAEQDAFIDSIELHPDDPPLGLEFQD